MPRMPCASPESGVSEQEQHGLRAMVGWLLGHTHEAGSGVSTDYADLLNSQYQSRPLLWAMIAD